MSNKHLNQQRTMPEGKTRYKKIVRNFVMALTVMIFVFGSGLAIYKHLHKTVKVSQTITVPNEIPGWWYQKYFGKSVCDSEACKPQADPDSDKLTNAQEYFYHTDPLNFRTAGDDQSDGSLVAAGFDPSQRGQVAFDDVATEDNIIGESLVFDQDIQKIIAESQDISKVNLPLVKDEELKITYDQTDSVYKNYFANLRSKVNKYFSPQDMEYITQVLQSGNGANLSNIESKGRLLSQELKLITVPDTLLNFHKYNIAFYQLLSKVLEDPASDKVDEWYDNAQAFLAVQQKLNLEKQLLSKEFGE